MSKYFKAFNTLTNIIKNKKVAPTITQPKQLKKTLENISKDYKYSSAREKESIKRLNKKIELEDKRKEGIKASKELKKMVDTGRAEKIGSRNKIFSKQVPPTRTRGEGKKGEFVIDQIEKKAKGGRIGYKKGSDKTGVSAMDIKSKIAMKKKKNGKTPFGMLSVKAGIDKNPNPTYADKIAGGKMKNKKKVI